ncbi:membrane-associated phospholipid phosphatase [Lachnospiraceae bacterium PF1-21]|uniref:Phosphatase PAP2 family protein n=2 Tax=Ohessyouella blattaphilus TaxID=2949333 RepID=A0ABT1EIV1_9FIRM|nr:phosphatase PAP2 family protein [Ohessyouella blattaphilus]MCP1110634.1 phosphatase PAP2 family protein [Ohessyouella blattaphilus]MCR8564028.1 phosphatase PAP2 family protein [Ohessyouella blattaphilus]MDL2249841.1 phosphatase PAP2 family protein [Lachnospiraceae bacterium OttesenSCG-928-J05]
MQLKSRLVALFQKYKHAWVFLYFFIYMPWFTYLERREGSMKHYLIHSPLDDYIPFIEYFIVPYLLWFIFMAVMVLYFFFTNKKEFYDLFLFLALGMTIFLIISTFYPNGLELRPTTFARDNIFVDMVKALYASDTPTNVLPSIHVFNSVAIAIAAKRSKSLKKHPVWRFSCYIIAGLIVLSTMFLKQHSVTDVVAAFVLIGILYQVIYASQDRRHAATQKRPIIT